MADRATGALARGDAACPAAFVKVRCVYPSVQNAPDMYATVQKLLRRRAILKTVKLCAKAVQNVSARTYEGLADCTDAFRYQMKLRNQ